MTGAGTETSVGSIKFTYYVRFHGRTRATPPSRVVGATNQPKEVAESMMSYADLQAQLAAMCGA